MELRNGECGEAERDARGRSDDAGDRELPTGDLPAALEDERDHERPEVPEPVLERQAEDEREQGATGLATVEPVDAEQREPGSQRVDEPVETGGEKRTVPRKPRIAASTGSLESRTVPTSWNDASAAPAPSTITITMCTRSSGSNPSLLAIPAGRKKAISPGG